MLIAPLLTVFKAAQAILLGPKAVTRANRKPAKNCITCKFKIGFLTIYFLAYVTCLVCAQPWRSSAVLKCTARSALRSHRRLSSRLPEKTAFATPSSSAIFW